MVENLDILDGLDVDIPALSPQATAAVAPAPQVAEFLGPYQLIQQVGKGGVARVMRARHIHPSYGDQTFAIKILHDELSHDPLVVTLFRHEAYVLSHLQHPNIVRTFEAGVQDERLFIAMEYIDGRDLDNMLTRCHRQGVKIPLAVAMHIIGEVLRALNYAHDLCDADGKRLNLIHRDINPANVFVSYDGRVKLGDFGVASIAAGRVERDREIAGKVGYFSPEQLAGEPIDQRADLFALGVMMFEMLCGTRLFEADTTDKIMRLNKRAKIPKPQKLNPDIRDDLETVILWALERDPAQRVSSAREMLSCLAGFIPPPAGMALAVASMMRQVFLSEHVQELQMREGLAGVSPGRGSGQLVALYSEDERAQAAFNELLLSRGYRVETHADKETLRNSLAANDRPDTILLDLALKALTAGDFANTLERAQKVIPIIGFCESLEPIFLLRANAVGVVDLLFKPFNIERVLTSIRAAVTGATRIAAVAVETGRPIAHTRLRLLLMSHDPELIERISVDLNSRGFTVESAAEPSEALARLESTSYNVVLYDAQPASPADRYFAGQCRSRPGMGLVPFIYLAEPQAQQIFAGVESDRSAVLTRTESALVIGDLARRLHVDTRLGRTFIRYPASLSVEVRYGGRMFEGQAVDISRGGVMFQCEQMSPVGTEVSVSLHLPSNAKAIEVQGRVVRVDLPRTDSDQRAGIGVEFEHFAADGETELIAYLAKLTPPVERQSTQIMQYFKNIGD